MRRLEGRIDARLEGITDPFERVTTGVRTFLGFCAEHPEFVELLVQERAQFKDRKKPTYFEHREAHIQRWRDLYGALIGAGKVRDIPVERITDVVSMLLYGALFTNYFAAINKPAQDQAEDILDILFHGILNRSERCGRRPTTNGREP